MKIVKTNPTEVSELYRKLKNKSAVARKLGISHERVRQILKSQESINAALFRNRLAEAFWEFVDVQEGCWVWKGRITNSGYGVISFRGRNYIASAVSFFLYHGHWANGETCHTCDNSICVSFYHLFEGTHAENMQDMAKKLKMKRMVYTNTFDDKSKR